MLSDSLLEDLFLNWREKSREEREEIAGRLEEEL